ncbi:hypothetical protein E2C01_061185 [Portunus trituberculatus]|uniref:Uncharacterized protein n=1 Tax=Portunus trituberculatus TaxID=210409 RepID=A0A5B7HBK8_PORTR|nr:hypothetical protein [Portunus trituberculatus]
MVLKGLIWACAEGVTVQHPMWRCRIGDTKRFYTRTTTNKALKRVALKASHNTSPSPQALESEVKALRENTGRATPGDTHDLKISRVFEKLSRERHTTWFGKQTVSLTCAITTTTVPHTHCRVGVGGMRQPTRITASPPGTSTTTTTTVASHSIKCMYQSY